MTALAAHGRVIVERYCDVRSATERLAQPLSAEDQTVQSMPDVSPTKWHRAHTSWFFEEFVLGPYANGHERFHPAYRYLFNSYYEAVGARHPRPQRGVLSRPGVDEVAAYRRNVDDAMLRLLDAPLRDDVAGRVELGLHHEQQHQELLLMDIKHVLSMNPLLPAYAERPAPSAAAAVPAADWMSHPGGLVDIGNAAPGFSFDNEGPCHTVLLRPFVLADRPVTCGEWLEFMHDGGYRRPELWLSDGWAAVQAEGWAAPLYWAGDRSGSEVFTLFGPRRIDPAEPVCHVSYYEADAFARWAGARLPTEAEWEALARDHGENMAGAFALHPRPAAGPAGRPLFGEVWEWTSSPYTAYPRFRPAAGAIGEYNGKFMVNQQVLRGGCCATPPGHARPTYRNFFPPAARWPFTGLRLARDG